MIIAGKEHPVLYFDGVCNLCNHWVTKVIKSDPKRLFRFASLQSEAGQKVQAIIKEKYGKVPDSVVLEQNGKYYIKSDVAMKVAKILGGWYNMLLAGYILPKGMRNGIYDFVARNRYKWFGKKEACMIPTPELKSLFIED